MSTSDASAAVRKLFEAVARRDPLESSAPTTPTLSSAKHRACPTAVSIGDGREPSGTPKGSVPPGIVTSRRPVATSSLSF